MKWRTFFHTLMTLTETKTTKYILITSGVAEEKIDITRGQFNLIWNFTQQFQLQQTETQFQLFLQAKSIIFHVICTTESSSIFHVEINKTFFRIILQAHCEYVHSHPDSCFDNVCCLHSRFMVDFLWCTSVTRWVLVVSDALYTFFRGSFAVSFSLQMLRHVYIIRVW